MLKVLYHYAYLGIVNFTASLDRFLKMKKQSIIPKYPHLFNTALKIPSLNKEVLMKSPLGLRSS